MNPVSSADRVKLERKTFGACPLYCLASTLETQGPVRLPSARGRLLFARDIVGTSSGIVIFDGTTGDSANVANRQRERFNRASELCIFLRGPLNRSNEEARYAAGTVTIGHCLSIVTDIIGLKRQHPPRMFTAIVRAVPQGLKTRTFVPVSAVLL